MLIRIIYFLYCSILFNIFESIIVRKNRFGDNGVYCVTNGQERLYDSRGDLFVALRNVAVQLFPNVEFGNEPYIYNGNFKCFEGDNYESKVID